MRFWLESSNKYYEIFNTINYKLCYDGIGTITGYSDADYAGDLVDRKSTSGYIIMLGNSPLTWSSKKQATVATSTAEAEYVSTAECLKTILWLKNVLRIIKI